MSLELTSHKVKLFSYPGSGKVEQTITLKIPGRVKFQGTYWPACLYHQDAQVTLFPEDTVTVIGRQGITLLVVPLNKTKSSEANGCEKLELEP